MDVVRVRQGDASLTGTWVGTLDGFVNAQIQPHVSGYLVNQNYREGSPVARNQVLFEIDQRPFQAAVDQAEAQMKEAKGQLAQAEAQQGLAQINLKRDTPRFAGQSDSAETNSTTRNNKRSRRTRP